MKYPHAPWQFLPETQQRAIVKTLDEIADPELDGPQMLAAYRKWLGWTQKELAEKMCVTVTSVSRWESGIIGISRKTMAHVRAIVVNQLSERRGPFWWVFAANPSLDPETATLEDVSAILR